MQLLFLFFIIYFIVYIIW